MLSDEQFYSNQFSSEIKLKQNSVANATPAAQISSQQVKVNNESQWIGWKDFYLPQQGEVLSEIDIFKDYLTLYYTKDGIGNLKIIDMKAKLLEMEQEAKKTENIQI